MKIHKMSHPRDVSTFINTVQSQKHGGKIDIYFEKCPVFPAAAVPISGIIQTLKKNISVKCHYGKDSYISVINLCSPYNVKDHLDSLAYPFAKVWKFTDFEDVTKLVDAFTKELLSLTECSRGLIEGLTWSLNEVMDNVIQHSLVNEGYIMAVYHKNTDYFLVSIYDAGQGIYNSLRNSEYHPRNAIDAISIAIQEGKTRDKKIGQGNGLWGLCNILEKNKGKLTITSAGGSLMLDGNKDVRKFDNLPVLNNKNGTTAIDIAFNCKKEISIAEALNGYTPEDINFGKLIDDNNFIKYKLSEKTTGFGTREAGIRVRNEVVNFLTRLESTEKIEIDFSDISVISSSFADEFIGKLVVRLGFYRFSNMVKLSNANKTIEAILNRSIVQRLTQLLSPENQNIM